MSSSPPAVQNLSAGETILDSRRTTCCIVGGGPAGCMLALLLARRGVPSILLEMHKDFEREFRGDTVHPSTMEILDQLGLAEKVLALPHTKISQPQISLGNKRFAPLSLSRLKTKYPYILLMHQPVLLEFLTQEAARFEGFQRVMRADVLEFIEENGAVCGVRYQNREGWHEVRARLTVGCDGRFSRLRKLAGFEPKKTSPPMDVLWFRLPRLPSDPDISGGALGGIRNGHLLIVFDRRDYWQVGYVILKGSFREMRAAGLESLRQSIAAIEPRMAQHAEHLTDWKQCSLLSVESSRCGRWHKPGLLLIGDAAHVMSPIGGVGINMAVQDAVVAANELTKPLLAGRLTESDLARVQKKRQFPTRFIQGLQTFIQERILTSILQGAGEVRVPWFLPLLFKIPILRDLPPRWIALGVRRVRVKC